MSYHAIDVELLKSLEELAGGEFPAIVQRYLLATEKQLAAMEKAYLSLSYTKIFECVHSLKGSSGTLAANNLYELCFDLEQACSVMKPDLRKVGSLLDAIQQEFQRVRTALIHYETSAMKQAIQ